MAGDANQFQKIMDREGGLQRGLTTGQLTMIAIGGAIGTGLFLGSGFAIGFAGPSVLISYAIGAVIAFLLMGCLAEMTVAHPTSGSFGAFAEHYINPWAGFAVRYSYWACIVAAVGVEISAVAVYMKYWFPTAPGWIWIVLFSAAMNSQLYITTRMMFSLSRAGYAPKRFGTLSKKGVPTSALSLSTIGIALAAILEAVAPDESFILMMGISLFGAMFTWFMIFVTHLFFRRKWEASGGRRLPVRMIGFPYLTLLGAGLMLAIMFTTWFTDAFQMTLLVGVPWMILITLAYWLWKRAASNRTEMTEGSQRDQVL